MRKIFQLIQLKKRKMLIDVWELVDKILLKVISGFTKKYKKINFFPCNNGLGHISRTTKLANYLAYYKN